VAPADRPRLAQRPHQARLLSNANDDGDQDATLHAADVTLRISAESWLKVQAGRSEGLVSNAMRSDDGGYDFYGYDSLGFTNASADAYRADVSFASAISSPLTRAA
jgi:hypothetical protein